MKNVKKQPLYLILIQYLKEHKGKKIHSAQLEKVTQSWGCKAYTGMRRLQEVTQFDHPNYDSHVHKEYGDDLCSVYWYV